MKRKAIIKIIAIVIVLTVLGLGLHWMGDAGGIPEILKRLHS